MISIEKAGEEKIPVIQDLAERIWNIVYPGIISREQIDYMLDLMYGTQAMQNQILVQHHQFLIISENELPLGFASYSLKSTEEPGRYRLHKLYVLPDQHGKGLGRKLLDHISGEITPEGASVLELNVNRKNPATGFYQKMGFMIEKEMILDIGNGYVMDDYVMALHYQ